MPTEKSKFFIFLTQCVQILRLKLTLSINISIAILKKENTITGTPVPSISQPTFTCSKLTVETLEQGAKYVQS